MKRFVVASTLALSTVAMSREPALEASPAIAFHPAARVHAYEPTASRNLSSVVAQYTAITNDAATSRTPRRSSVLQ